MGVVYRAYDPPPMDREVALKTLPPCPDPLALELFYKECRILKSISHPNVVEIFDMGVCQTQGQPQPFFVMPLLQGQTLEEIIRHAGPRLTVERVVEIIAQTCRGLQAAHDRGLIHRDLKPSNIFVMGDDSVKLIDFGVARGLDTHSRSMGHTKGTLLYMAPEQAQHGPVSERSDVFSLGVVCYEALTRQQPFRRATEEEVVQAIFSWMPPPACEIERAASPLISRVVQKAMAKSPVHRFATAREFGDTLQKALRHEPIALFDPARIGPRLDRAARALENGDCGFAGEIVAELDAEGHTHPELTRLRAEIDRASREQAVTRLLDAARARCDEGEEQLALHKLDELLRLDPSHTAALALREEIETRRWTQQIEAWLALAAQHLASRSHVQARDALQRVLAVDSTHTRATRLLKDVDRDEEDLTRLRADATPARHATTPRQAPPLEATVILPQRSETQAAVPPPAARGSASSARRRLYGRPWAWAALLAARTPPPVRRHAAAVVAALAVLAVSTAAAARIWTAPSAADTELSERRESFDGRDVHLPPTPVVTSGPRLVRVLASGLDHESVWVNGTRVGTITGGAFTIDSPPSDPFVISIGAPPQDAAVRAAVTLATDAEGHVHASEMSAARYRVVVAVADGGWLRIQSSVPDQQVSVDGTVRGTAGVAPVAVAGPDDRVQEVVVGTGGEARRLPIATGNESVLDVHLFPMRESGVLVVRGEPADATVILDGRPHPERLRRGTLRIPDLAAARHTVVITREGFEPSAPQTVTIRNGRETTVNVRLAPVVRTARLVLTGATPASTVTLDDAPIGQVDADGSFTFDGIAAGTHTLVLAKPEYDAWRDTREFAAGDTVRIADARLSPTPIPVVAAATPPPAVVAPRAPVVRGLEVFADPGAWKLSDGWFRRRGGGFVLTSGPVPAAHITFTLRRPGGWTPFTNGTPVKLVVGYVDARTYVLLEIDEKHYSRTEYSAGRGRRLLRVEHGLGGDAIAAHVSVRLEESTLEVGISDDGVSWRRLDRWTQPGGPVFAGRRFGFHVPGNEDIRIADFAMTPVVERAGASIAPAGGRQ